MFAPIVLFVSLVGILNANLNYHPRNIPHDNLEDDLNNVGSDWQESGDLQWDEVFRDEYEDRKKREEIESDLESVEVTGSVNVVPDWPQKALKIGQVGGVAVDSLGLLHILHRAGRKWDYRTFDKENKMTGNHTRIQENTIMVVNASDGRVMKEWGQNFFSLPHGLHIDHHDNVYVTDVALHQVFKFNKDEHEPVISLGTAYKPATNNDEPNLFCQPTDIAVASNGDFFVSDGYCNSRIMKYSGDRLVGVFGQGDSDLPHSLALVEESDLLCVADREGMRVLCYRAGLEDSTMLGEPVDQYFHARIGPVYAIAYNQQDSLIYGVSGKIGVLHAKGFTLDVKTSPLYSSDFVALWSPSNYEDGEDEDDEDEKGDDDDQEFKNPHAIATKGNFIYVGEVGPNVVWKFKTDI